AALQRLVAWIRPEDLVALGGGASGLGDWAGTDDLPFRHRFVEARERGLLGASEAQPTVALSVGAAPLALAGVDPAASLVRRDRLRQAVGADHIFVVGACGVDRADVLVFAHRERQAYAVAALDVALAVSDAVEHITARRGAKRISLILADLELRAGPSRRGAYRGSLW